MRAASRWTYMLPSSADSAMDNGSSRSGRMSLEWCNTRHGFSRPRGSARSMNPPAARMRRWKEQFATVCPRRSAISLAVASPTSSMISRMSIRSGWARARITAGSVVCMVRSDDPAAELGVWVCSVISDPPAVQGGPGDVDLPATLGHLSDQCGLASGEAGSDGGGVWRAHRFVLSIAAYMQQYLRKARCARGIAKELLQEVSGHSSRHCCWRPSARGGPGAYSGHVREDGEVFAPPVP